MRLRPRRRPRNQPLETPDPDRVRWLQMIDAATLRAAQTVVAAHLRRQIPRPRVAPPEPPALDDSMAANTAPFAAYLAPDEGKP